MTKYYFKFFLIFVCVQLNFLIEAEANGSAGTNYKFESTRIVDFPNAGLIPEKYAGVDFLFLSNGGLNIKGIYSPWNFLNFGLSYGGNNIIGSGDVSWQEMLGFNLKCRLFGETIELPALAFGFSNQGFSAYLNNKERFEILSPGLYLVLSKSFKWKYGIISLHSGINYSFDNEPEKRTVNLFAGLEQTLGNICSINLEYNLNLDEPNNQFISSKGMINLAGRISISEGITIELQLRDLLNHLKNADGIKRQINLEYIFGI